MDRTIKQELLDDSEIEYAKVCDWFSDDIEPTHQKVPKNTVQIVREEADSSEIVKEEPQIYEEYDNQETSYQSDKSDTVPEHLPHTKAKAKKIKGVTRIPAEASFECYICHTVASSLNKLNCHFSRLHAAKPFICHLCPKRLSSEHYLLTHLQSHTGTKPFECKICMRTFGQESYLRRHNRSCRFATDNARQTKGKQAFACNICRSIFSRQIKLVSHMTVHTTLKRFKCDICLKTFTTKRNLKRHMRLHTGKGMFRCDHCLKEYTTKYTRDVHAKKHKLTQ